LGADVQARDSNSEPTFGKEMTAAQKAILSRVCSAVAMHFAQAISTVSGFTLDDQPAVALRSGSTFEVPKDALRCECEFEGLDTEAGITLLLGADALATGHEPEGVIQEPENAMMVEAVGSVAVQVVAELGTVELGLRRVLSLQPGDTLRLSTPVEDPIALKVAGIAKFDVSPVIARGQLAVQIKGRRRRDA
jgi:flagellar motor switch/type III secretory pathway protein FliN